MDPRPSAFAVCRLGTPRPAVLEKPGDGETLVARVERPGRVSPCILAPSSVMLPSRETSLASIVVPKGACFSMIFLPPRGPGLDPRPSAFAVFRLGTPRTAFLEKPGDGETLVARVERPGLIPPCILAPSSVMLSSMRENATLFCFFAARAGRQGGPVQLRAAEPPVSLAPGARDLPSPPAPRERTAAGSHA